MARNKEVPDDKRRIREHDDDPEAAREYYRSYRELCYGSGAVSLTWAREMCMLAIELSNRLEEKEKDDGRSN